MQNWKYFQTLLRIVLICNVAALPSEQRIGIRLKRFVRDGGLDKILADNEDNSKSFICNNGKRIQSIFKCDEDDDCGDRSDEKDCFTKNCAESEFQCNSGKCIRKNSRCNGHKDCRDGSDEVFCKNCSSAAFTCASGQCVLGSFQCNSRADCIDGSDENCPEGSTPSTIQEYWHSTSENQFLTRVFANEDLGVYFDPEVDTQVNWFFHLFSDAWKYIKSNYGPIGTNPILYLVLHEAKVGCATSSFLNQPPGYRTLLECGPLLSSKWNENTVMFESLFSPLGIIIREGAYTNFNNADTKICEDQIKHIFFYDIYIHLKVESSAEVSAWEARTQVESVTVKENKRFCFRDWFLPIYKQFGKGKVLNNYLQNTKSYWPVHRLTGYTFFKLGEWVHFWSGSAGMDLRLMALKAFTWTTENQKELTEARQTYRALRYIVNSYTLAFDDNNIAFKFVTYRDVNNGIYQTLSNAWKYMKLAYNPRNENPQCEIILEDRGDRFKATDCTIISQNLKPTPSADDSAEKQLDSPFQGYTMKCGKSVFQNWDVTPSAKLDDIVIEMAKLVLTHILGTDDPAAVSNKWKGKPAQPITADIDLELLMVYDIYMELGRTDDAERWKSEQSRKLNNFPERSTHLFRDWYLEIYTRYDTRFLKVVKEFALLVNGRFNSTSRQLNVGEFVHFWSGAMKENLIDLAVQCFKWNAASINQFNEARIKFPGLDYDCNACDSKTTKGPEMQSEQGKGAHTIAIAVGVSATILIAALICFSIKYVTNQRRIQNLSQQIRNLTPKELDEFRLGNPNCSSRQVHGMIHSLPFKNEFEVPRDRLVIGDEFLGTSDTVVAVKAVKQRVDATYFKAQLLEIKIMAYLGKHDNIASLLATVTKDIIKCEVLFALEFCAKGDLYQYLNKHRTRFTDLWSKYKSRITPLISSSGLSCDSVSYSESEVKITPSTSRSGTRVYDIVEYRQLYESSILISTLDLLTWSRQIACGMEYLGLKEVIHGDLAARNVLLTENDVAKISDFGLSRQLVNYSHYQKTSNTPVPWRWLAIESLTKMTFSLNSDVWSFGVTLWELFTLGNVPYMGKNWDKEFVSELNAGLRLDTPEFGNQEIYKLMMNCMKKEPAARMPFSQIGTQLEKIRCNLAMATAKPLTSSSL